MRQFIPAIIMDVAGFNFLGTHGAESLLRVKILPVVSRRSILHPIAPYSRDAGTNQLTASHKTNRVMLCHSDHHVHVPRTSMWYKLMQSLGHSWYIV